jgi:hypothetical protein
MEFSREQAGKDGESLGTTNVEGVQKRWRGALVAAV